MYVRVYVCSRLAYVSPFHSPPPVPGQNFALTSDLLCAVNSTGAVVSNSTCDSLLSATAFSPSNVKRYTLIYHLFGLLWTNEFIEVRGATSCHV